MKRGPVWRRGADGWPARSSSGYRVTFALAELYPAFGNNGAALAGHRDGKPLDAKEVPYRRVRAARGRVDPPAHPERPARLRRQASIYRDTATTRAQ